MQTSGSRRPEFCDSPRRHAHGVADDICASNVADTSTRKRICDVDTAVDKVDMVKFVTGEDGGVNIEKVFVRSPNHGTVARGNKLR